MSPAKISRCASTGSARAGLRAGLAVSASLALAALGAASCASHPAPTAPTPIRLAAPDIQALAAILRLEDRREFDATAFAGFARSAAPEVRRRAYVAAGRIADPAARLFVRAGLSDPDLRVRAAAALATGLLRDTASVPALRRLLTNRDTTIVDAPPHQGRTEKRIVYRELGGEAGEQAMFALGRMNTAAAHNAIEDVLAWVRGYRNVVRGRTVRGDTVVTRTDHVDYWPDGNNPPPAPPVIAQTLLGLWRYTRQPEDAELAEYIAFRPDYAAQRWQATYALMRLGDPAGVPALLRLVKDSQPDVRALAARGLRAVVVDSAGQRAVAVAALTAALADAEPPVRINAATALAGYRDPASVAPLSALLHDADRNVGIAAAQALGASRQGGAGPALQALADSAGAPLALRAAALTALARVSLAGGVQLATTWAAPSQPWRQRFYAASALEGQSWRAAPALYAALLHDADSRVVANALTSLQAVGTDSTAPRSALVEALGAADPFVRAAALGVLAARADPADLQLFLDSYARAARDTFDDAAVAAVDALAALQKRGAPAAAAFFARFQRSPDFVVRLHATALGDAWGSPRPVETGRPDAFYMDVVRRLVLPALAGNAGPRLRIKTEATALGGAAAAAGGDVVIELTAGQTPLTVDNLMSLARLHFFDGNRWHRVVPNFVAQDGDPRGDGNGGPGWAIRDELTSMPYARGAFGMALSGPDTGGSQFFITLSPQPHLDAGYTLFGRVVEGMDVVDRILQDDRIRSVEVIQ